MFKIIAGVIAPFAGINIAIASVNRINDAILSVPSTGSISGSISDFYGAVLMVFFGGLVAGLGLASIFSAWREASK